MTARIVCVAALVCGLLATAVFSANEPTTPFSRIERVTVYADRADIQPLAEDVHVATGANRILFRNLPGSLLAESVRASGMGDIEARIVNVDVKETHVDLPVDEELRPLEERSDALALRIRHLEAQAEALTAIDQFLSSVRVRTRTDVQEQVTKGTASPDYLRGTIAFLREEVTQNGEQEEAVAAEIEELRHELNALRREISSKGRATGTKVWTAAVELLATEPGEVDVLLEYSVRGAGWRPQYDVYVSEDLRGIEITVGATVSQRTGEDWDDVLVVLSTAEPALGAQAPQIQPWLLQVPSPQLPEVLYQRDRVRRAESAKKTTLVTSQRQRIGAIRATGSDSEITAGVTRLGEQIHVRGGRSQEVAHLVATTGSAGLDFAATFEVPARQSLPSDGTARRMEIANLELEGEVAHESAPKLSPHAYMVAKLRNEEDFPLVAGPTRVILGRQFLGKGTLGNVAPGQEFSLSLGVDRAVQVKRTLVSRDVSKANRRGSKWRTALSYRLEVVNHRLVPVKIALFDQLPLCPDEEVEVKRDDIEPSPAQVDDDGNIRWDLAVASGERVRALFGFEVKYPVERKPSNLP